MRNATVNPGMTNATTPKSTASAPRNARAHQFRTSTIPTGITTPPGHRSEVGNYAFTAASAPGLRLSVDHLIRPQQQRRRDGEVERFSGLEVDHQLELGGLLDREVTWLGAPQNLVDIDRPTS